MPFLRYKVIGAPEKFKTVRVNLFRPRTYRACHQKPNPSRETVPLKQNFLYKISKQKGLQSQANVPLHVLIQRQGLQHPGTYICI
jgi:hypothetical protein